MRRPAGCCAATARADARAAPAGRPSDDRARAARGFDGERLLHAIERIRLIRGGGYRFVLPIDLGETVIADDVTPAELREALRRCGVDL